MAPAQDDEPNQFEVLRSIYAIQGADSLHDDAIGAGGVKSDLYAHYERVRDHATASQLLELTKDDSLVTRCYGFRALVEARHDVDVGGILLEQLEEIGRVWTFRGCIRSSELFVDVLLREVDDTLHESQRGAILGRLLEDGREIAWRRRALWRQPLDRRWRETLLRLADGGDDDALVALAHQHHEEAANAKLIVERLGQGDVSIAVFEAARLNAQASLLDPLLAQTHEQIREFLIRGPESVSTFLRAVARHDDERVTGTLLRFLGADSPTWMRSRLHDTVSAAASENLGERTDIVLWRLLEERHHATQAVLERLVEIDTPRAYRAAETALRAHLNDTPVEVGGPMLELVRVGGTADATKLAAQCIADADVHHIRGVAEWAATRRDNALVEPLFQRYENDTNPHVYLAAARALVQYETPEIDARLRKSGERDGWGGKKLRSLLEPETRTHDD